MVNATIFDEYPVVNASRLFPLKNKTVKDLKTDFNMPVVKADNHCLWLAIGLICGLCSNVCMLCMLYVCFDY